MYGFLNVNKPSGLTSHDCVALVRRRFQMKKVGHGGTLDPAASGVLPIAVGQATRLLNYLPEYKAYQARIRFGIQTNTDDLEGEIIQSSPGVDLSLEQVEQILPQFVGSIAQIPPIYSAIKQKGKKLYQLARLGETIELTPRQVQVHQIEVLAWIPGEFPEIELAITCGPGTYIRAIARDLGKLLNVGGTLANLVRTQSGSFTLNSSLALENLTSESLISPIQALSHLAVVQLDSVQVKSWCQGQKIMLTESQNQGIVQVQENQEIFRGIGRLMVIDSQLFLIPQIVFK